MPHFTPKVVEIEAIQFSTDNAEDLVSAFEPSLNYVTQVPEGADPFMQLLQLGQVYNLPLGTWFFKDASGMVVAIDDVTFKQNFVESAPAPDFPTPAPVITDPAPTTKKGKAAEAAPEPTTTAPETVQ